MSSSTQTQDQHGFKKPMSLGSKSRSFIPMTPRNVKTNSEYRNDFARQVADHTGRGQDGQPPQKKFRSSAAPKGTRLASGYVDRTQERMKEEDDEGEDKQKRLKALEEMLKLQQIDMATFENLRDEIGVGGTTSTTHLVKGLDFKLLERIRRGEDLEQASEAIEPELVQDNVDVDEELEKALDQDTVTGRIANSEDKEVDNTTQPSTQHERSQTVALSRNEILELMKQRRKNPNSVSSSESPAAFSPSEPGLDHSRFRKLESKAKPNKHKFTESINGRRREVLVITDKQGNTKRKTRWLDPEPEPSTTKNGSDQIQAWGADLPAEVLARMKAAETEEVARRQAEAEEDDGDIFGGVADYDPLAAINSDEDEASATKDYKPAVDEAPSGNQADKDNKEETETTTKPLKSTSKPRNYFATSTGTNTTTTEVDSSSNRPSHDPAILAALKRAAQIRQQEEREGQANGTGTSTNPSDDIGGQTSEEQVRSKALLQKLQKQSGYDDMDIDMGFGGGSRYDDEEEEEGDGKQKLSQWTGIKKDGENEDEDEEGEKKSGGAAKRKRGGGAKKRKGDKNSFTDVMSVIEGRKKG